MTTPMSKKPELPEYTKPPVIEVVLGVQFKDLGLLSVDIGQFWQTIKERYPNVEDHPPIDDIFDRTPESAKPEVIAFEMPPLRRAFFIDESGNFILQFQSSRLLTNWRRLKNGVDYPRFEVVESRFIEGWERLNEFLSKEGRPRPIANQYELTYINHIVDEGTTTSPTMIQDFVPIVGWGQAQSVGFLPSPRFINVRMQFPLPDNAGTLHASLNHGTRRIDGKGVYVLELLARGAAKPDASDMRSWFEVAHEWIVRGFTDLTSDSAQKRWGRTR
jgi:uncharacterized protein (TIGR04255 family)